VNAVVRPAADWELAGFLKDASESNAPVEVVGGGSKRDIGRPERPGNLVSTHILRGVRHYEPADLIMSAQAGTLLSQIEYELARKGQMLAFEPIDLGPVLGKPAGLTTIGGVFSTNASGSRRVVAGAARDHLIGVHGVSGSGTIFRSGGRVLRNSAGFDLCRVMCGSWGALAILLETTFRVMPRPEETQTIILLGLTDEIAVEAMSTALGTPYAVTGAVHIDEALCARLWHSGLRETGVSVTAIRLECFSAFMARRIDRLKDVLRHFGELHVLDDEDSQSFWGELRQLSVLQGGERPVWRISTAPRNGAKVVASIRRYMPVEAVFDWSGGLVWLEVPVAADAGATDIRRALGSFGGHAMLIRAPTAVRRQVEAFHPFDPKVEQMTQALKAVFDPVGVLNPGRMNTFG
jgi:glycolate oxidase FAD binding subunit